MGRTNAAFKLPPPVLENLAQLGSRITFARKIQKLRQDDLAAAAGISRSTIVEIEKGSPFVTMGNYMATLWALGLMNDIVATDIADEERRLVVNNLPQRVRHG